MVTIPAAKLDRLVERWQTIQAELNAGPDQARFIALSKEFSDLDPIVATINDLRQAEVEKADLEAMIADKASDKDMVELARDEIGPVGERIEALGHKLQIQLLPKDAADDRSAILEVRAGTGGDEAALFAADLFRMYSRYADLHGWKVELISASENDLGGYREVIASITGKGVFARLKFESGVHRVQRIPVTETKGRIHTSTATVAIMPEAEEVDLDIKPEDIRIDTMRAGGAGGQHVNKTESAVRITHLPTGLMVVSAEKSQHQNRRLAMQVLRSRLYELQRQKADDERAKERQGKIGTGDRSQRIRSYHFPEGRVSDHRIGLTLYKLPQIIAGEGLDELIDALVTEHQASLLASMEGAGAA
ncbi:MAG: peptide chain release factor 1 [Hyphomicrobiaceae bacterium]